MSEEALADASAASGSLWLLASFFGSSWQAWEHLFFFTETRPLCVAPPFGFFCFARLCDCGTANQILKFADRGTDLLVLLAILSEITASIIVLSRDLSVARPSAASLVDAVWKKARCVFCSKVAFSLSCMTQSLSNQLLMMVSCNKLVMTLISLLYSAVKLGRALPIIQSGRVPLFASL
jgi:hypothetical protein